MLSEDEISWKHLGTIFEDNFTNFLTAVSWKTLKLKNFKIVKKNSLRSSTTDFLFRQQKIEFSPEYQAWSIYCCIFGWFFLHKTRPKYEEIIFLFSSRATPIENSETT